MDARLIGLLYLQLIGDKTKSIRNRIIAMLTVTVMLIFLLRFVSSEMAILFSTFAGCFMGIIVERKA